MAKLIFWFSILFIFYSYFGYPLVLWLISLFRKRTVIKGDITPSVSFIITAYNEEKGIQEKIENTLTLDYPREKLEIIVASDYSTDRTDGIVSSFESKGIRLIRAPERRGKEGTQKLAIEASYGEILVFSDVATILEPNGVSKIVKSFNDPTVGCVSSHDRFLNPDGKVSGEGAYVRYEMLLRRLETKINSLVGLSGSFFAARQEVCDNWATDLQSDFNTLLNSMKKGLRGVIDEESIGYYRNISDNRQEYERKVRTVLRGISVFMKSLPLLNFLKYGMFSWQLISHKLCRWLVPFAMVLMLGSNILLAFKEGVFLFIFLVQLALYSFSLIGLGNRTIGNKYFIGLLLYFLTVNCSILNAWMRYFRGDRIQTWRPSAR
jgi:cellulose synthase/poly-beta-1,6-N-acetylglucosamine synthase-like glycosyltransferase